MNKPLCVLGVLRTKLGLAIKAEMLSWLSPVYEVICVEQEPPGSMFEFPALKTAAMLSTVKNEPILYLHTKGASNPVIYRHQVMIRQLWAREFITNKDKYFELVNSNEPIISCPYSGDKSETWWNGMIINTEAAKILSEKMILTDDRFYYETMCNKLGITVKALLKAGIPYDDMCKFTLSL